MNDDVDDYTRDTEGCHRRKNRIADFSQDWRSELLRISHENLKKKITWLVLQIKQATKRNGEGEGKYLFGFSKQHNSMGIVGRIGLQFAQ